MERNEGMKKPSNLYRKKGEITYASGLVCPKTTALFFDKIWIPDHKEILVSAYGKVYEDIPSEITFCENDLKKSICSSNLGLLKFIAGAPGNGTSNNLWRSLLKDSTFRESILNKDILANAGVSLDDDIKEVIDNWSLDAFKGLSTEKKIMQKKNSRDFKIQIVIKGVFSLHRITGIVVLWILYYIFLGYMVLK